MIFKTGINSVSGVVNFTGVTEIPEGAQVIAAPGTVFRAPPGIEGFSFKVRTHNVALKNIRFESGGVFIETPDGKPNENIVVDNCEFTMPAMAPTGGRVTHDKFWPDGVVFTCGLKNGKLTNNYYKGNNGGFAIFGYNYDGLTIANNEIDETKAGIHIDARAASRKLLVEQNAITRVAGMGLEFQGNAADCVFIDNWFDNPVLFADRERNKSTMAYSLILAQATGPILIARNYAYSIARPDGEGARVGIETGGDQVTITDNHIVGFLNSIANNDGEGTGSVTLMNNCLKQYINAPYIAFPKTDRWMKLTGVNDATWVCSWLSRGKPRRGVRFPTAATPVILPPVDPTVAALLAERDSLLLLSQTQATTLGKIKAAGGW